MEDDGLRTIAVWSHTSLLCMCPNIRCKQHFISLILAIDKNVAISKIVLTIEGAVCSLNEVMRVS